MLHRSLVRLDKALSAVKSRPLVASPEIVAKLHQARVSKDTGEKLFTSAVCGRFSTKSRAALQSVINNGCHNRLRTPPPPTFHHHASSSSPLFLSPSSSTPSPSSPYVIHPRLSPRHASLPLFPYSEFRSFICKK